MSRRTFQSMTFLPSLYDMRCKASRIFEIMRAKYHRDPLNGDVYIFMSKDQTKVKKIHYEVSVRNLGHTKFGG